MFQKLAKNPELLKNLLVQNTLDECYDFCAKIQDGYTKEELRIFFDDLGLLAKKLENSKIELGDELDQVCGGIDTKNFNRKFLSTFLSALTLSGTFSVGAVPNHAKTNRENVLARNSPYSRRVTNNQKKNQTSKLSEKKETLKKETLFSPDTILAAGLAIGGLMIYLSEPNSSEMQQPRQFNAGLKNLGVTCFSNALLQQLYSIKSFRTFVNSINSLDDLKQYDTNEIFRNLSDTKQKTIQQDKFPDLLLKKINEFKKIFRLMETTRCVDNKDMEEYTSIALTGYPGEQQDVNECYMNYLADVADLYQMFLTKNTQDAAPGNTCICGFTLEAPTAPKTWDDHFKSTFQPQLNSATLRDNIDLNPDRFIDRYQEAYMKAYRYTDDHLQISLESEKPFLSSLSAGQSKFMNELIQQIVKTPNNALYKKYMFSTLYLMLKHAALSSPTSRSPRNTTNTISLRHQIRIYAARAFSARQQLSESELKYELNSIFEFLAKYPSLTFGSIKISDLEKISDDDVNLKLHNLVYNEVTDLFRECYDEEIKPSGGADVLSQISQDNPAGIITPVDGQIAFFLNRTLYDINAKKSKKSCVKVGFPSNHSSNGFEWDYRGKTYVLSAASVHGGTFAESGHYYTYKLEADGNWYEYNDDHVYKTTWQNIKDTIETTGVMFTFTEKSVFEQSAQNYALQKSSAGAKNATTSPGTFATNRCCMAGTIDNSKVALWEQPPQHLPKLKVIPTGNGRKYDGITDPTLLNQLTPSHSNDHIALIDAANNDAQGGGGVDGAIFNAMGQGDYTPDSVKETIRNSFPTNQGTRIQTGGCIIHDSFGIKKTSPCATHVIQAVGPRISDTNSDNTDWATELYSAYFNAFVLGIRNRITTFITAPLSLGLFCSVVDTDKAQKVGKRAANILIHAINDAEKFTMIGKNIKVYVTDHNVDGKPRKAAEDAFIRTLYESFPSQTLDSDGN